MSINIFRNNSILRGESRLTRSIFAGVAICICLLGITIPRATNADFASPTNATYVIKTSGWALVPVKTVTAKITAYSSTANQTDDTPFITASGKFVSDGIIANNALPFGTKVKIPALYGDKVFTVEDRMNRDKSNNHIDIWMPSYTQAVNFGVKIVDIQILES